MKAEAQKTQLPKQPKKAWQKPDFYLIDSDNVNAKHIINVNEATGHVKVLSQGTKIFATPNENNWFQLTSARGFRFYKITEATS